MKKIIIIIITLLAISSTSAFGGNWDGWEVNIFGINPADFKDRKVSVVLTGCILSHVVHELGHMAWAQTHGGGTWNLNDNAVIMNRYYERSHSDQQMFHRAGFAAQLLVGGILTLNKSTRHSDFALGFNSYTAANTLQYTITGGGGEDVSDIKQLDNGVVEGSIYTVGAGMLSYINLDRE